MLLCKYIILIIKIYKNRPMAEEGTVQSWTWATFIWPESTHQLCSWTQPDPTHHTLKVRPVTNNYTVRPTEYRPVSTFTYHIRISHRLLIVRFTMYFCSEFMEISKV